MRSANCSSSISAPQRQPLNFNRNLNISKSFRLHFHIGPILNSKSTLHPIIFNSQIRINHNFPKIKSMVLLVILTESQLQLPTVSTSTPHSRRQHRCPGLCCIALVDRGSGRGGLTGAGGDYLGRRQSPQSTGRIGPGATAGSAGPRP